MKFRVVVPASSANLGPGFDSMAIALGRYMTVDVESGDSSSSNAQRDELTDGQDMVLYAMRYLADSIGRDLPSVSVHSESCIPVARGMGSSAAALIAGMLAGNRLLDEPLGHGELLKLATHIEGHADNLAAALNGGAVLAFPVDAGQETVQLDVNVDMKAVVFIPHRIGFTTDARVVVPETFERRDAVFNASRCALLVHALASNQPDLLREAMRDRLHQPYRLALYPYLDDVISAAVDAGAYGASLSGSGPTILALTSDAHADKVAAAMCQAGAGYEVDGCADTLVLDRVGAQIIDPPGDG